jgi:hypothetical protein
MSTTPLDPLAFARDALAARGALVEDALAVLPDALAAELELPADVALSADASPDAGLVSCAIGSALLERLVAWARRTAPSATARMDADAPRASQATSLAGRFVVRNAVTDVDRVFPVDATYAVLYLAWTAEADDRHAGLVRVVANTADGSVPAASFGDRVDPRLAPDGLREGDVDRAIAERAASALTALARSAVEPRAAVLAEAASRRHRRDHARIRDYFAALAAEARSPRRKIERAAIEAKLAQLDAERDAKLRDLVDRYAVRVSVAPAAAVFVSVPALEARIRVRRRKETGELALRLPPFAQELDALACAACGRATSRPAVCDERLHPLCETCVPAVQGRPACGACRRGA